MKFRLQAIDDDGRIVNDIEVAALHIPQGGDIVVRVNPVLSSADMAQLSAQLKDFFGARHRVIMESNDDH